MTELFADIPERVRKQTDFWIDVALHQHNLLDGMKMIETYRATCSEEEKEYFDFAFAVQMEFLKHESDFN